MWRHNVTGASLGVQQEGSYRIQVLSVDGGDGWMVVCRDTRLTGEDSIVDVYVDRGGGEVSRGAWLHASKDSLDLSPSVCSDEWPSRDLACKIARHLSYAETLPFVEDRDVLSWDDVILGVAGLPCVGCGDPVSSRGHGKSLCDDCRSAVRTRRLPPGPAGVVVAYRWGKGAMAR